MEGTTTISNEEYLRLKKLEDSIDNSKSIKIGFFAHMVFLDETDTIMEVAKIAEERQKVIGELESKCNQQKAIYTMGYTSNEEIKNWSIWDFLKKRRNIYK